MQKFVHIVFGDSAAGTLRYFFKKNQNEYKGDVINFREEYSVGPLYEIDTEAGHRKRIKWVEKLFKEGSTDDYFEDIKKDFMDTYASIKNIENDLGIIIWHGENTSDQVGLRYLSSLFSNRELHEVDVSKSNRKGHLENSYIPRALGECAPEEITHYIPHIKKLDQEKCNGFKNDWGNLSQSKENLRILEDSEIIGVDESYYDNEILVNCTFNFKMAARVIGATMGNSVQVVGDTCAYPQS